MRPRRPKVKRYPDGTPHPIDRCNYPVQREGEIIPDMCKRARQRGSAFCRQHQRKPR